MTDLIADFIDSVTATMLGFASSEGYIKSILVSDQYLLAKITTDREKSVML